MTADDLLRELRGGLIVSCQAAVGTPLHGPVFMSAMAKAAVAGGAVGIRAEGIDDLRAIRSCVDVPIIGLWKTGTAGVYITPTADHAIAIPDTGAELIAVDATARPRPDGRDLHSTITAVHERGALLVADVSTLQEGLHAAHAGADVIATTLSGYTEASPAADGPDLELVAALAEQAAVPIIAEGRIGTPEQAREAIAAGAWAVVVGTAITAPSAITARFADALQSAPERPTA